MYTIGKTWTFDAAHHLEGLPPDHKCARVHGHTYRVTVELQAPVLDSVGFVRDYGDLAPVKKFIDEVLDHRDLNEAFSPHNPTAEYLAETLYDIFNDLLWGMPVSAVVVQETPNTFARYEP